MNDYSGRYPAARPRRLRQSNWVRRLVRETQLSRDDLIWAMVVHDGAEDEIPVAAMPGVARLSVAAAAKAAKQAEKLGIPAIAVFPHIDARKKDTSGKEALNPNGLVCTAVRAMKDAAPDVGIMVDVALDPFTDHGHDGLLKDGRIVNDETVAVLVEQALVQVGAGADIVAPSDMMDGRVGAIRAGLDAAGFQDTLIMSYAAKYASAFYGPYREAIGSGKLGSGATKNPGDKRTYQMDSGNTDEALREVAMDIAEGADLLLVKPGLPYLDIVRRVKDAFALPTYAFQVSGEYAMLMAAAKNGWIDEERAIMETLLSFKRAGADGIVTYFAPRAAALLGA
ncbi:porphobilinogen synthase [Terricaulis sp.]|uniref:porphobilinogen synthase n=1 Tax=Terricaulis sp. TaxID=2768686 RepID=UPI003783A941